MRSSKSGFTELREAVGSESSKGLGPNGDDSSETHPHPARAPAPHLVTTEDPEGLLLCQPILSLSTPPLMCIGQRTELFLVVYFCSVQERTRRKGQYIGPRLTP